MNCMTFQNKLRAFGSALGELSPAVYHYFRVQKEYPCIVWQEEGGSSFTADNRQTEIAPSGSLDYFTNREYDPVFGEIEDTLRAIGASYRLNSIQYEEQTGLIHYEWEWEM